MINIFGAGLAGLIAARMLTDMDPLVYEKQESLPNNHSSVLRFRSDEVSTATNIPFAKVRVIKSVHGSVNAVSDAIRYSRKVTSKLHARSILDLEAVDRWIAPEDFVARIAKTARIIYGVDFQAWSHNLIKPSKEPIISTIPIPAMMDLFGWDERPSFGARPGWTGVATINPELGSKLHCTLYYPGPEPFYRASITASRIMVEGVGELSEDPADLQRLQSKCRRALKTFGLSQEDIVGEEFAFRSARYQKIEELSVKDRESVKRFIMWLSKEHEIYSLGRFATWRPKLLLDDIVNDVRVIRKLIESGNGFDSLAL